MVQLLEAIGRRLATAAQPRRGGFALVLVVWATGLLAVLAAAFTLSIGSQTRSTAYLSEAAKAEATADGGVELAVLLLMDAQAAPPAASRKPPFGRPLRCTMPDGSALAILAEDEGGKVDLNTADERLLRKVLARFMGSDADAAKLVDAIVDFRDADDLKRVNGAEEREYRAAGLAHGPKDATFDTIDEIEQVLGIPPALPSALRPYLTVHSRQTGIDPAVAARAILEAAAGLASTETDSGEEDEPSSATPIQIPPELVSPSSRQAFRLLVEARLPGGAAFTRDAIIELTGQDERPFVVRSWSQGRGQPASPAAGEPLKSCLELP